MTFSISAAALNSPLRAERDVLALADDLAGRAGRGCRTTSLSATTLTGRPSASRRPGSRLTWISRTSPPLTCTAATPSICSMSGFSLSSTVRRVTSDGCDEPTANTITGSAATSKR